MSLALYYHPLACHKVLIALYELGIAFEPRIVNLGDAAERGELEAIWPFAKFPVIRDASRGRDLAESTLIVEYLDHHHARAQPLIPSDWDEALQARLWDRIFDNHVQGPMQQTVSDRLQGLSGDKAREKATLLTAYSLIERQLQAGPWIAGGTFSMADCAAAPALFYASTLQAFSPELVRLRAYFERLVERPSVRRVLDEAAPYFRHYPFADAIAQRFRAAADRSLA